MGDQIKDPAHYSTSDSNEAFPPWAQAIGWLLALGSISAVPIVAFMNRTPTWFTTLIHKMLSFTWPKFKRHLRPSSQEVAPEAHYDADDPTDPGNESTA